MGAATAYVTSEIASSLPVLALGFGRLEPVRVYCLYALIDLLATPARTLFTWGRHAGTSWLVTGRTRMPWGRALAPRRARTRAVALVLCALLARAAWVPNVPGTRRAAFCAMLALGAEDYAYQQSHLLLSITHAVLLLDDADFATGLLLSLGRLWLISGLGKFAREFWDDGFSLDILVRQSGPYARLVRGVRHAAWFRPFVRALSLGGAVMETLLPFVMAHAPLPWGLLLCVCLHLYIVVGFFAPMLWNVASIALGFHLATLQPAARVDTLLARAAALDPPVALYVAFEALRFGAVVASNLGRFSDGSYNWNIHGGNWASYHVYARRDAAALFPFPLAEVDADARDHRTHVRFRDSLRVAGLLEATPRGEYMLVPLLALWEHYDLWWCQVFFRSNAQDVLLRRFLRDHPAIGDAHVRLVKTSPSSWCRARDTRRVSVADVRLGHRDASSALDWLL